MGHPRLHRSPPRHRSILAWSGNGSVSQMTETITYNGLPVKRGRRWGHSPYIHIRRDRDGRLHARVGIYRPVRKRSLRDPRKRGRRVLRRHTEWRVDLQQPRLLSFQRVGFGRRDDDFGTSLYEPDTCELRVWSHQCSSRPPSLLRSVFTWLRKTVKLPPLARTESRS